MGYFKKSDKVYSALVLMSGGSFYTLKLLNSNWFGLKVFMAGMSKAQIEKYATHKIILTTCLENIPQLTIQLYFMIKLDIVTTTVIIAAISSVFNILLSIMSASVFKAAHQKQIEVPFEINMSWTAKPSVDIDGLCPYSMVGQKRKLGSTLYAMDTANDNAFGYEILSSIKKTESCAIFGIVKADENCIKKEEKINTFFKKSLKEAVVKGFDYAPEYTAKFDFEFSV